MSRLTLKIPEGRLLTPENFSLVKLSVHGVRQVCLFTVELGLGELFVSTGGLVLSSDQLILQILEITLKYKVSTTQLFYLPLFFL